MCAMVCMLSIVVAWGVGLSSTLSIFQEKESFSLVSSHGTGQRPTTVGFTWIFTARIQKEKSSLNPITILDLVLRLTNR